MTDRKTALDRYGRRIEAMQDDLREGLQRRVPELLDWAARTERTWLTDFFHTRLASLAAQEPREALIAAMAEAQGEYAPSGLILTCDTLALIFVDKKAREILGDGRWLIESEERLAGSFSDAQSRLEAGVSEALASVDSAVSFRIEEPEEGNPLLVRAQAFLMPGSVESATPFVILRLLPDQPELPLDENCLIEWYGLTNAEAKLAVAFAGGEALAAYADRNGVSINTVRTLFSRLKTKLDAPDQAAVVRIVLLAGLRR